MRRSLALRRSAAALALPLVVALTACGADSDSEKSQGAATESTPTEGLSESPDGGSEQKSGDGAKGDAQSEGSAGSGAATSGGSGGTSSPLTSLDADPGDTVAGKEFAAVTKWALDNATTANVKLEATGQGGVSGAGAIDHTTSPVSLQLAIDAAGMKGDVRVVGGAIYMSTGMAGDDKYLKLDVSDMAGSGMSLSELDPSRSLEGGLKKTKFTYRGTETIDGVRAERFSAKGVDVWFDESGMFRRVKRDLGSQGVTTATYSDWGTGVDISAPPADQVQEMPKLPQAPPRA